MVRAVSPEQLLQPLSGNVVNFSLIAEGTGALLRPQQVLPSPSQLLPGKQEVLTYHQSNGTGAAQRRLLRA